MSILSVDTISPIGSGTTVTLNATETKVNNFITVGTGATISSPSSNVLTLGTNNTERLRIKSDGVLLLPTTGKLSVGPTNPVARFQVGPANGSRQIEIEEYGVIRGYNRNGNAWAQIDFEASSYSFDCGGTERLRIASDGQLTHNYDIGSNGDAGVILNTDDATKASSILFRANNENRARIDVQRLAGDGAQLKIQVSQMNNSNTMLDAMTIAPVTSGDTTPDVTLAGNLKFASGGGIDFSSYDPTSYGSISSEILDDYEEGSWTPTEVSGLSLTVYVANYIKIGRLVHVECGILIPTNSDGGGLQFDGLPYQAVNSGDNSGGLHLTSTNSNRNDTFYAIRNQTKIGVANLLNQNVARSAYSNKQLKFSGTYISTF